MAGSQIPGPLGVGQNTPVIDKGTSARTASPLPGPIGKNSGVTVGETSQQKNVDDAGIARLREIQRLVKENNQSSLENNLIVCQIFMESRFDARAGAGHNAKGLMQMQKQAVQQVYKYRKQKELGHMPSDKQTKVAFEEGAKFHSSEDIFDEAKNIQIGTEYMQYWIDTSDSIEDAYKRYRGLSNGIYYKKISACAEKMKSNPDSMQPLLDMVK